MRNNFEALSSQRVHSVLNAQVVQATRKHHHQVGEILFGAAEHILDNPGAFHSRQGMFHANAHLRDALIGSFLCGTQHPLARLFLGWRVRQPRGS
jgi:hypothetical protein